MPVDPLKIISQNLPSPPDMKVGKTCQATFPGGRDANLVNTTTAGEVYNGPTRQQTAVTDHPRPDGLDHIRQLAKAVKVVNESGQIAVDRELSIALGSKSGQPVMRLIDRKTREIVQQIPEERVVRMAEEFKRASATKPPPGGTDWLSMLA